MTSHKNNHAKNYIEASNFHYFHLVNNGFNGEIAFSTCENAENGNFLVHKNLKFWGHLWRTDNKSHKVS
jgi:hypothetical protein